MESLPYPSTSHIRIGRSLGMDRPWRQFYREHHRQSSCTGHYRICCRTTSSEDRGSRQHTEFHMDTLPHSRPEYGNKLDNNQRRRHSFCSI